jgi:hypothetical protein
MAATSSQCPFGRGGIRRPDILHSRAPSSVYAHIYDGPKTVVAEFAMPIANCRARGLALSGVCLRVVNQRPWARRVLTAYGTMWSETSSRVREAPKRLATSRSDKLLTQPVSFLNVHCELGTFQKSPAHRRPHFLRWPGRSSWLLPPFFQSTQSDSQRRSTRDDCQVSENASRC